MINKKYKKALAFLITTFAFFAFSTGADAVDFNTLPQRRYTCYLGQTFDPCNGRYIDTWGRSIGVGPEYNWGDDNVICSNLGTTKFVCGDGTEKDAEYIAVVTAIDNNNNSGQSSLPADYQYTGSKVGMPKDALRFIDNGPQKSTDADSGVIVVPDEAGGTISGKNVKLDGGVCKYYKVCFVKNTYHDYLEDQNGLMYTATPQCKGTSGELPAMCLEPQFGGPASTDAKDSGYCLDYAASPIDPTNRFHVSLYELYKIAKAKKEYDSIMSNPGTYFKYEVAARLLAFQAANENIYLTRSNTANESKNNRSKPYREGLASAGHFEAKLPGVTKLAQAAWEASGKSLESITASTYGIRITQSGGFIEDGSTYKSLFTVEVQNVPKDKKDSITTANISISPFSAVPQGAPVYYEATKTLMFTYLISGLPGKSDTCTNATIKATLNYSTDDDIRHALLLDAVSQTSKANRQRFLVFVPGENQISYELPVTNCPGGGKGCPVHPALYCNDPDKVGNDIITVNEGAPSSDGITDWVGCIIGNEDARGNSYDVVDNSKFESTAEEETGEFSDDIKGFTSYLNDEDGTHVIKDAAFCQISCKEKYQFVLPGYKEQVKQGTYFSFHSDGVTTTHMVVGINAERACVSGDIKNSRYNDRALDLRAQMVDYFNAYLYYHQIYNTLLSKDVIKAYNEAAIHDVTGDALAGGNCPENNPGSTAAVIEKEGYKDKKYLTGWSYDGISVPITLYQLKVPSNLEDWELEPKEFTINNLTDSYKTTVGNELEVIRTWGTEKSEGYDFYKLYEDKDVFNDGISGVAGWDDQKDGTYHHKDYHMKEEEYTYQTWTAERGLHDVTGTRSVCDKSNPNFDGEKKITIHVVADNATSEDWKVDNYELANDTIHQYDRYKAVLESIKGKMDNAKEMFNTLVEEIAIQNASIQECTNYLTNFDSSTMEFNFNPIITFSYPDQGAYMAMLAPNILVNKESDPPKAAYAKCTSESDTDPESLINNCRSIINKGGSDNVPEGEITFQYLMEFSVEEPDMKKLLDSKSDVKDKVSKDKIEFDYDKVRYFNVGRVGSVAFYGRHDYKGSKFEWYQSATQFYTIAPDGIITTNKGAQNANILDTDGRVYPVAINTPEGTYPYYITFANIGQFNESGSLGRIMGGGDGKAGTMSGETYDQEVCYYQVCRIDDPTCFGQYCEYNGEKISLDTCIASGRTYEDCAAEHCPATNACINITRSEDCNKGQISSSHDFSDTKFLACLKKLSEANCCNEFQAYISQRQDGIYSGSVPNDLASWYGKECDQKETCDSFTIISKETYFASSSLLTDNSFINNNGALQLNARTVSNYNLFPNGATGINWKTDEAEKVIQHIESMGDGIFDNKPDYKITLNNQCAEAIRDYNLRQAGNGSGYSNGGFNDFTNNVNTNNNGQTIENLDEKTFNSVVTMSDEFKKLLEDNCGFETNKSQPGREEVEFKDRSRVLS